MNSSPVRVERRAGQRFPYLLPVSFSQVSSTAPLDGLGFTQDLSSRGVFFVTEASLSEGSEIELTLRMPSEITLGESMPVRCRGRILRIVRPGSAGSEAKIGVAVRLESYEYLPDPASPSAARLSALHSQRDEEQPESHPSART